MIYMVVRIQGGAKRGGASTLAPPRSFKDVLKLGPPLSNPKHIFGSTFVVEQLAETPSLEVKNIACGFIATNYDIKRLFFISMCFCLLH